MTNSQILDAINQNIKRNENKEITGVILNSVLRMLLDFVNSQNQSFNGVLTTQTKPNNITKGFWFATEGVYPKFGITVPKNNLGIIYLDNGYKVDLIDLVDEKALKDYIDQQLVNINLGFGGEITSLTQSPTIDGMYIPKIIGVYPNFGNLEYLESDGFVVFLYKDGVFSKINIPLDINIEDEVKNNSLDAVNGKAVEKYAVKKINTISELRNTKGEYEGQIISLLGYYESGDKEPLNYKWSFEQGIDDDGSVINTENGSWIANLDNIATPEDFGAIGDGIKNDYLSFYNLNNYLFNKAYNINNISYVLLPMNGYSILLNPNKSYFIEGENVLGSIYNDSENIKTNTISMNIIGNSSCIIWKPLTENSCFFRINGFLSNPLIKDINIFISKNNNITSKYQGNLISVSSSYNLGVSGAKGLMCYNITTSVYNDAYFNNIITVKGNTQADQMYFENCSFSYFKKAFECFNQESVNNVFNKCSFFGGDNSQDRTYFYFTKMGDNFIVKDSNFSIQENETVLYNRSNKNADGMYLQSNHFKFTFDNIRFEFYGTGEVNITDIDFGEVNITNCNFKLGSTYVKSNFKATQMSSIFIKNSSLPIKSDFYTPIFDEKSSYDGYINYKGISIESCNIPIMDNLNIFYKKNDEIYNIIETYGTDFKTKLFYINNSYEYGSEFINEYDIKPNPSIGYGINSIQSSNIYTLGLSANNVSIGNDIKIPPYQVITEIKINTLPSLDPFLGFEFFRVYFGNKITDFVDYPIPYKDKPIRNYTIFNGSAVMLGKHNKLKIVLVKNNEEESELISSDVYITYKSISKYMTDSSLLENDVKIVNNNIESYGNSNYRGVYIGQRYFNTDTNKPLWWNGTVWVDSSGMTV